MRKITNKIKGIHEWDEKLVALSEFLGLSSYGNKELAIAILGKDSNRADSYDEDTYKFADALRKYDTRKGIPSDPSGQQGQRLLSELTDRFREVWSEQGYDPKMSDGEIRALIIRGTALDFVTRLFPKGGYAKGSALNKLSVSQLGAAESIVDYGSHWAPPVLPSGNHRLSVSIPSRPHEFMEASMDTAMLAALKSGRLDQKYHFLTPRAEGNWREVVSSGTYKQYEACKLALVELFKEEVWCEFFRCGADGSVMLGCGAGSKDELIIDSMLECSAGKSESILHYELVDVSPYMLRAARYRLAKALCINRKDTRIQVGGHEYDFVDGFSGAGAELSRPDRNIAWFLPGGTLGNLSEGLFFNSIGAESKLGDLLIVGVEIAAAKSRPTARP